MLTQTKITKQEVDPRVRYGLAALNVLPGTYLEVIAHEDTVNKGDTLIRTNKEDRPFVNVKSGDLWGSEVSNYTFKIIEFVNIGLIF